jgi:chromosome partitioning protein
VSVIAVVNRKGGCGKSTLACHLAVWLAQQAPAVGGVMLADTDFQHTLTHWLQRRRARSPGTLLLSWVTDARNLLRPPGGVLHSVLDSPGGLRGFDLARLLVFADLVLIPVCDSVFDYDAASACLAELRSHPRVSSGRVKLAVVGVRIAPGGAAAKSLADWAAEQGVEIAGSIRSSEAYVGFAASGLTLFDAEVAGFAEERLDWLPVLRWVESGFSAAAALGMAGRTQPPPVLPRPGITRSPASEDRDAPVSRFMAEPAERQPARTDGLWRRLWSLAAGGQASRQQHPA